MRSQNPDPKFKMSPLETRPWRTYGIGVLVVVLCTALDWPIFPYVFPGNMVIVYLVGVLFVAVRYGIGPSIFVSLLSVMAFGFIYVPYYRNFAVPEVTYFYLLGGMLVISLLISGLTGGIRQRVEMARLAKEAEEAQAEAKTERMRNTILSSISHDLRTPLATIKGAASSLLENEFIDSGAREELTRALYHEADRLDKKVKNLLYMTRLEAGAVHLQKEWLPVEEVVGSALTKFEGQLHGHTFRTHLPPELPLIFCDGVLIEQVFSNLLENALKYTPSGTSIDLSASVQGKSILFEIADQGEGIPAGDEIRIFEKFYRAHPSREGGVGLGLAICRGIIEAHGGRIWAENQTGGGVVFRFMIPHTGNPPKIELETIEPHDFRSR
jgi:K+-sensing histidine kinase KdpD